MESLVQVVGRCRRRNRQASRCMRCDDAEHVQQRCDRGTVARCVGPVRQGLAFSSVHENAGRYDRTDDTKQRLIAFERTRDPPSRFDTVDASVLSKDKPPASRAPELNQIARNKVAKLRRLWFHCSIHTTRGHLDASFGAKHHSCIFPPRIAATLTDKWTLINTKSQS